MTVLVTEPPPGTIPHVSLAGRFHIESGTLAVGIAPDVRRIGAIALTILETIGKDLRVTGGNAVRNDEHVKYAPVWAAAHNLDRVAVLDGQRVTAAMAGHLRALLGDRTQIVAVCESGTSRRTLRLLNRDGAPAIALDWDEFIASNPTLAQQPDDADETDGYSMDDLPTVDFIIFRHTAQQVTEPETFAAIDRDYRAAYNAATTLLPDIDAIIEHLDRVTWDARSTAPILTAIKATQAALFARGWLLRARADNLMATLTSVRHPRPTVRDWRALRAYIRPERSAVVALYLLGTPAPDIPNVTIGDIDQALAAGDLNGKPIPELAKPILTAELLRRRSEGHPDSAPYLTLPPGNPRRHLEFIIDARRDLGLPIDGRNIRTDNATHQTRLLYSLGLDLGSLT